MSMEPSDLISVGGAFVAGLAALYARWSANASRRQNEIALHSERLRVYRGVVDYGCKFASKGPSIKQEDVWSFDEWVQLSEFYFNKSIFDRLDAVFMKSLNLLEINDEWCSEDNMPDSKKELSAKRNALYRELRDECFAIRDNMKECLRIAQP